MPYIPHGLVTFRGTLGNPAVEQWSIGLRLGGTGAGAESGAHKQSVLNSIMTAANTFFTGANFSDASRFMEARLYSISTNGKSSGPIFYAANPPTGTIGRGTSTNRLPWQVALAVTLQSDNTRPPGKFGRVYMPVPNLVVEGDGMVPAAAASNFLTNSRIFFDAINDAVLAEAPGNTRSICIASNVGTGSNSQVTTLRVGRVLDTQRRRRRSMLENYVTGTLSV